MNQDIAWKANCMWIAERGPIHARILFFGTTYDLLVWDARLDDDAPPLAKGSAESLDEAQRLAALVLAQQRPA